jgi:2-amino-4-hydroxy-6-hydroxymethyldihydropteridine diphosphokinase
MSQLAWIGLGSNLGDREEHLALAVATLSETHGLAVRAVSRSYETAPVGGPPGQGGFLNAAAALETTLDPEALLDVLQDVEARAGRVRTVRWGERTLDLDLLLYADRVVNTPRLRVPHPLMALRRFVLAPLAEIASGAVDPITQRTVADLLANLDRRPSYVAIASLPRWDLSRSEILDNWPRAWGPLPFVPTGDPPRPNEVIRLLERTVEALPALAVEDRIPDTDRIKIARRRYRLVLGPSEDDGQSLIEMAAAWLDREVCSALAAESSWLVSHFWFDALFLAFDSLKSSRPRFRPFLDAFLEARQRVLSPTFVVVRTVDFDRYGLHDPRYAWRWPIGGDAPVLLVDDFASDATLTEVLATCAATRPG